MRRKKARRRRKHKHHLLQQRAAKTETVNLPETNTILNPLEYFKLDPTGCVWLLCKARSNYEGYSEEDFRYYLIVDFELKHRDLNVS